MPVSLRRIGRTAALLAVLAGNWAAQSAPPAAEVARKFAQANEYVQVGKPDAAIPLYKDLTVAFPAEPSFGVNLVIAEYKAGLYRDALAECERLIKLRPELFPAWLFRGASYVKLGDAGDAIEPLRKALTLQPDDRNARIMLADALLALKRHAEAIEQYSTAVQAMPESSRVWYGLRICYLALTEQLREQLATTAPMSGEFMALSGDFESDRAEWARAFQHYRQAMAIQPDFRGLHAKVADIYGQTGHPDWEATERTLEGAPSLQTGGLCVGESAECEFVAGNLEKAAAVKEDTPAALYWRAQALRSLGQRAYARLQELPPARERYEAEAATEEQSARYRDAAASWKQALALAPGDNEMQRRLALALCHSNDCAAALPLLQDLLSRAPASVELNYLYGLALNSTQDAGQAVAYLETAVRLDGSFLPARAALGEAYLQAGKPQLAVAQLEAARKEDETGSRHYQLARAYQNAGKKDEALGVLRAYREILDRRAVEEQNEPRVIPP